MTRERQHLERLLWLRAYPYRRLHCTTALTNTIGVFMPRRPNNARRTWSAEDARKLKQLAKQGLSGAAIAKHLNRTSGAIYQRASVSNVSLIGNTKRARVLRRA